MAKIKENEKDNAFKIRHIPTGEFMEAGGGITKKGKVFTRRNHATLKLKATGYNKEEFEIVEFELVEKNRQYKIEKFLKDNGFDKEI